MADYRELGAPSPAELRALKKLRVSLPADHIVTSNYRLHNVETDGVVIAPGGVVCIEFKDLAGIVTPRHNGEWGRDRKVDDEERNPYEQGDRAAKKIASDLRRRSKSHPVPCYVDYLIVLNSSELTARPI